MPESLVIDWLNENSYRAYPLLENIARTSGGYTLTDGVIVDAQLCYSDLVGAGAGLTNITVDGANITVVVNEESFVAPKAAVFPYPVRNSSGNLVVFGEDAPKIPNGSYDFTNVFFEPSVITEFGREWLGVSSLTFTDAHVHHGSQTLAGDITFDDGVQFGIGVGPTVVRLNVGNIFGIPISCEHFGGAPADCSSILSYINGVNAASNGFMRFLGGNGIVVLDDPPNHRIYIGLSFNQNDVCQPIPPNPSQNVSSL